MTSPTDKAKARYQRTPAGRCPFEYFHNGEPIPPDYPVRPIPTESNRP